MADGRAWSKAGCVDQMKSGRVDDSMRWRLKAIVKVNAIARSIVDAHMLRCARTTIHPAQCAHS